MQAWVLSQLTVLVPAALRRFGLVSVGAQDAFRAQPDFMDTFVRRASLLGAHRVRLADTVGLARPSQVAGMVGRLLALAGETRLEFHGHNDLGMATANTIAAIETGIDAVSITVNGLGERAGNAPLEQVAVGINTLNGRYSSIDTRQLVTIYRHLSRITKRPIAVDRPITGDVVFSHESGIHCAAVLKDPDNYQPFAPEIVGRRSAQLVVGRHSGSSVIKHLMEYAGVVLDPEKTKRLIPSVRAEALRKRAALSIGDLTRLYEQL